MIVLPDILLVGNAVHVVELPGHGRDVLRDKAVPFGMRINKAGIISVTNKVLIFFTNCGTFFNRWTIGMIIPNRKIITSGIRTVCRYSQKIDSGCCCE